MVARVATVLACAWMCGCGSTVTIERGDETGGATAATTTSTSTSTTITTTTTSTTTTTTTFEEPEIPGYVNEACPEAAAWRTVCMTLDEGVSSVVAFELESGAICNVANYDDVGSAANGLALFGDHIVFCGLHGIARIHVPSGATEEVPADCASAADWDGSLLTQAHFDEPIIRSAGYDAFVGGVDLYTSSMTPVGACISAGFGSLYASWFALYSSAQNEIERWDIASETLVETIPLPLDGDWIDGIAPLAGGPFALLIANEVRTFSPAGEQLASITLPTLNAGGLRCWTN